MSSTILFILEGPKDEPKIIDSIWETYFKETSATKFYVTYDTHIYILWKELQKDPDLDLLEMLIERNEHNRETLEAIKESISEVYLLFDYDGHAPEATDSDLQEMLSFFDEETEQGKLFISYPMIQALRHYNPDEFDFQILTVPAKENIRYKNKVGNESKIQDVKKINKELWNTLCEENLRKGNHLICGLNSLPTNIDNVEQITLFSKQLETHIETNGEVAVLSSIPFFLYHYYGNDFLKRIFKQ